MDAELLALCKQTVTRIKFVSYDDHNDFSWSTNVTSQSVVLTGTASTVVLNPTGGQTITTGSVVVKDITNTTTYVLNVDYTINYTTGTIARTAGSSISSGATVHVSYVWQTITTFLARIEYVNMLMRDENGQEFVSVCQIYADYISGLDTRDKLILSGDVTVAASEIKNITYNPDENGDVDHVVFYLGK